jgi:hypothetical protein
MDNSRFRENWYELNEDPDYYPCWQCNTKGKIRHPQDRDVVEGYKGAPWHPCGKCNGSGTLHPSEYAPLIEQEVEKYNTAMTIYRASERKLSKYVHEIGNDGIKFILDCVKMVPVDKVLRDVSGQHDSQAQEKVV